MRVTRPCMGTVISIDIPDATSDSVFKDTFALLESVEQRFSPYISNNELDEFDQGNITLQQVSPEFLEVYTNCRDLEVQTEGAFSAFFDETHFNPTGYVKGWSIKKAAELISSRGYTTYLINFGGDIACASDGQKTWRLGIIDPASKNNIVGSVELTNGAMATSGRYERGDHIINPKSHQVASKIASATIVGSDISLVDAFATAAYVMGDEAIHFFEKTGYEALVIASNGELLMTHQFSSKTNFTKRQTAL